MKLDLLQVDGITSVECLKESDPILEMKDPIPAENRNKACKECSHVLAKGKIPLHGLANYIWLGEVPDALNCITYAEQIGSSGPLLHMAKT
jgi:hypothetical protein